MTFSVLGVTRDGCRTVFHRTPHGVIRIYAGNKDSCPARRTHLCFRYRTGRQIRWFDGKPELNWNVTGNFWHFPILPGELSPAACRTRGPVRWTAFTGRLGARGIDWQGSIEPLGVLTVSPRGGWAPGEGLTVVAGSGERGRCAEPDTQLWYSCSTTAPGFSAASASWRCSIYYFAAWKAVGRDPKGGTIIPLFHPPPGISPALANYIRDWGLGREKWRAFTAAALSLAVRGLVHFDRAARR